MPRVMAVVFVVGLLVWGLAFVDFGRPRSRRSAATDADPVAAEPASASAQHERAAPAPKTELAAPAHANPQLASGAQPPAAPARPASAPAARPGTTTTAPNTPPTAPGTAPQPSHGALSTATGELGEGNLSPEYAEMERSYAHEPRDGAWAEAEEQRLRALLEKSPIGGSVGLVNCQQTLCRLLLESDDYELYQRLLAVPGLVELTGLGASSAYSHRSGQLSVYFPRRDAVQAAR